MPISNPPFDEDEILVDDNGDSLTDDDGNIIIE